MASDALDWIAMSGDASDDNTGLYPKKLLFKRSLFPRPLKNIVYGSTNYTYFRPNT